MDPRDYINWRRYQPPDVPVDGSKVARLSPFTCLVMIVLVAVLLLFMPLVWGAVFPVPVPTPSP